MFQCERCGSNFSSRHTVGIENCPRCLLRDKTAVPLTLKVFDLPESQARPMDRRTEVPSGPELMQTESQS
jgi:ribosomal protein L37AE/L43A